MCSFVITCCFICLHVSSRCHINFSFCLTSFNSLLSSPLFTSHLTLIFSPFLHSSLLLTSLLSPIGEQCPISRSHCPKSTTPAESVLRKIQLSLRTLLNTSEVESITNQSPPVLVKIWGMGLEKCNHSQIPGQSYGCNNWLYNNYSFCHVLRHHVCLHLVCL